MYQLGDLLVYKKDVCEVKEIKENYLKNMDYYVLSPIMDKSLNIQIPTNSSFVRPIITKERVDEIIKIIPKIEIIKSDSKKLENE